MQKEYLIMDDGGNAVWNKITSEISVVYQAVKEELLQAVSCGGKAEKAEEAVFIPDQY